MNMKSKFVWISFLPLILACGIFSSPLATFQPQSNTFQSQLNLAGVWVPSADTLDYMKQLGYKFSTHNLEFKSDGTFIIVNIPSEWIFPQKTGKMDFYSGDGIWKLSEELITNMGDVQPIAYILTPSGNSATIQFGTVLDNLYFYPGNKSTEVNRIRFQKCFSHLNITDKTLEPLAKALNQSARDTLGFSPITSKDRLEIDGTIGTSEIWTHSYTDFSSHDILFRLMNDEYRWIFEQENFAGLEKWVDSDAATWEETITIQYQTEEINGGPINDLMIDYTGHDPRLINSSNNQYLSNKIDGILPILEEWRQRRINKPPSPESLCP